MIMEVKPLIMGSLGLLMRIVTLGFLVKERHTTFQIILATIWDTIALRTLGEILQDIPTTIMDIIQIITMEITMIVMTITIVIICHMRILVHTMVGIMRRGLMIVLLVAGYLLMEIRITHQFLRTIIPQVIALIVQDTVVKLGIMIALLEVGYLLLERLMRQVITPIVQEVMLVEEAMTLQELM